MAGKVGCYSWLVLRCVTEMDGWTYFWMDLTHTDVFLSGANSGCGWQVRIIWSGIIFRFECVLNR